MDKNTVLIITSEGILYLDFDEKATLHNERSYSNQAGAGSNRILQANILGEMMHFKYLVIVTARGYVSRIPTKILLEYLSQGNTQLELVSLLFDGLVAAFYTQGEQQLALITSSGMVSIIDEELIPPRTNLAGGEQEIGVKSIVLGEELEDYTEVVAASAYKDNDSILIVTEYGYAKKLEAKDGLLQINNNEYSLPMPFGGPGVLCFELTPQTGNIADVIATNGTGTIQMLSSFDRCFLVDVSDIHNTDISDSVFNLFGLEAGEKVNILILHTKG